SAACNEAVKLCIGLGLKPLKGFVNGVLRNISRNKKDLNISKPLAKDAKSLSNLYGFPLWLVELWIEEYGVEIARIIIEYLPPIHWVNIRINKGKTNRQEILRILEDGNIQIEDGLFFENALRVRGLGNVQDSPLHQQGLYTVQGESSMLVCRILDPRPHERILDTCSAPGGKGIYIAELMNMKGKIYAWDIHGHRVELIEKDALRMGATIVESEVQDATVLRPELEGSMDRVLIDAPCSGWGVLHKKPDIKLRIKEENMASLYELQRKILGNSSSYVKPGGVLVYSTCTINPWENNKMVEAFLEDHPEFTLEDFTDYLPFGLKDLVKKKGMIQLIPGRDGIDGFFVAKLRRAI
ncbi:MAG TPA: 16S rRNA (cytosine(967)-C(5))-methyltransferase RsmB, partial [Clostridia bacterium]|nr:16S rRNA (cytosine(967)-C(5))-methyltransferase RsmB [Clostridia bacterium]